jgi:D-alanyl-lipoteichoic acid acyltransferase DltB (MBOAT superfamily)
MLFNSLEFLFFFPITTLLYYLMPHRFRWIWLLLISCYFYMAFIPIYILILGFTIVIDYYAGILIEENEGKKRKLFLTLSLLSNIGVLCVFKYYNFINDNLSLLLHGAGYRNPIPFLSILLPIGLSFHTFQAMSYTIEVYRGNQKAERHFGIYSLYVMFYPQLVAGPIERPQNLLHQFRTEKQISYKDIRSGVGLMAWGLFKKVVIADRIGTMVDFVYSSPQSFKGLPLLVAALLFAYQIYCDFSGYSDIAIGAARVLGFKLMINFNRPFASTSIGDFWRRWHISLSTWFNDYLFTPIATRWRNYGKLGIVSAAAVTFFISGLWHGAAWTFILFGCLHGLALAYELATKKLRKYLASKMSKKLYLAICRTAVFSYAVFTWIVFRSKTGQDAWYIVKNIFRNLGADITACIKEPAAAERLLYLGQGKETFFISIILIVLLELVQKLQQRASLMDWLQERPVYLRYSFYYAFAFCVLALGFFGKSKFIYFQF